VSVLSAGKRQPIPLRCARARQRSTPRRPQPRTKQSKKQTLPFKVCYALAWPTLGGGIMTAVMPETSEVEKRLLAESPAELERRRAANAAAIARLRSSGAGAQQQDGGSV
jgi:hypothetical protein